MKKAISLFCALLLILSLAACSQDTPPQAAESDRDVIYQVSLLQGLTLGDYHGSIPVGQLKQHGDTGIGTFDALDGELIMVDGTVYRAAGDGSVEAVPDDQTIPFSNVTFLEGDMTAELKDIPDFETLTAQLNGFAEERGINRFYMIRIDGTFREMSVRSEYAQEEPYAPLVDVLEKDQTFFDYQNLEGTLVGLYCPPYMSSLNATGWHLHFISEDRTKGGHVLGLDIAEASLVWDDTDGFQMLLPDNAMFAGFDLTVDQSEDIKKVETDIRTGDTADYSGDISGWMYGPEWADSRLTAIDTCPYGSAGASLSQISASVALLELTETAEAAEAVSTYLSGMDATQKDFFSFQWQMRAKQAAAMLADPEAFTAALEESGCGSVELSAFAPENLEALDEAVMTLLREQNVTDQWKQHPDAEPFFFWEHGE